MSLTGFKKQFNKTSQFLSEKVGGNKGSEIDAEFLELGRKLDVVNDNVNNLQERTKEYLQPNPNARTKMALQSSYQKVRGQANSVKYPQPEFTLGEVFSKFGGSLNDMSPYALALVELGSSFQNLSETKDDMENQVRQNFIDPLYEMQQKDLKEIAHHRKKFEGRRLDFDYKKNKGEKVSPEELQLAQEKFDDSREICYTSMTNFMESEVEHISQLHEFSKTVRDYHQECFRIMDSLTESLSEQLNAASNKPRSEKLRVPSINSSRLSIDSYENVPPSGGLPSLQRPSPPAASQKPWARGLYDFEAENEGELAFRENDKIELISRIDENWLEGRVNGKDGYFPENYVEIIVPL